jgi:hypothetical protein
LVLLGAVEHGIVEHPTEDWEHDPPNLLQRYLGVNGNHETRQYSGAGHAPSDHDSDTSTINTHGSDSADELSMVIEDAIESDDTDSSTGDDSGNDTASSGGPPIPHRVREQVYHRPVGTPRIHNPFNDLDIELKFHRALRHATEHGQLPRGWGLRKSDANYHPMPADVEIAVGRRRNNKHLVTLPHNIWWPRAVLWAQALYALQGVADRHNVEI